MRGLLRLLLVGLVAAVAMAAAGDQAPAGGAPAAAAVPSGPQPTPASPPAVPAGDIPDFVPSEKVSADDAVSFPTDI